jgi:putative addiction module component (TIGR02574 family)
MTDKADTIAAEAAQLPRRERVAIIEKLLASLETEPPADPSEVADAWADEVRQRSKDLKDGDGMAIPWRQVSADGEKLFDAT